MAKIPRKDQRGNSEQSQKGAVTKNFTDLPQADQPVDPYESVDVPALDFRGEDVELSDFSGESGTGKG